MRALVIGVSGQDGAYLAELLLGKGYEVHGSSRDATANGFSNLRRLGIQDRVRLVSMAPTDFRSVITAVSRVEPDEIYNLSGQSSVGLSFEQPVESMESIAIGTLNILEAIRFTRRNTRLYNASSGECFGDTRGQPADETIPFRPRSPYAVAKATAHWEVVNYREAYGLFACNGILFNHESPRRGREFVTRKVSLGVARIRLGLERQLRLGTLSARRDWGFAGDYVRAMHLMLTQDEPADYVIGTGVTHSVEQLAERAFAIAGLDWREHVVCDAAFVRPAEVDQLCADPSRAVRQLGWEPETSFGELITMMVESDTRLLSAPGGYPEGLFGHDGW
jgi:GDPmannose 4,6-dehydratase